MPAAAFKPGKGRGPGKGWSMRRLFSRCGRKTWAALAILAAGAAGLWLSRDALLLWHALSQLDAATEQDRDERAQRVAEFGADAVPPLLDRLAREDPRVCANAVAALAPLAKRWGDGDPRTHDLARNLGERFPHMTGPGQEAALELQLVLLPRDGGALVEAAGTLLTEAAKISAAGVRLRALALAERLAEAAPGRWVDVHRDLVRNALASGDAPSKVRALHLALHSALRKEQEIRERSVPLLGDAAPEVRRAALLVVGMAPEVVRDDDLLPLLHDDDDGVRRLCADALRGRGLGAAHLKLAWLVTHREPAMRLEVLQHLADAEDLDPGVWLARLTHDPDWAVRVAAVRAAAEHPGVDLSARLREMQARDPSETVRGLAGYWLQRRPRR